jgi:hypothetical protein
MTSVAHTPKLSRIFDGSNNVLNGMRDHGLKRSCSDVVEGKRGCGRTTSSRIVSSLFIRKFDPTVLG